MKHALRDRVYWLEFDSFRWGGGVTGSRLTVDWYAEGAGALLRFRGGSLRLHPTREAAVEAPPLRIGPPFRITASADTLGPDATIQMAVEDAGGFDLSNLFVDGEERGPQVVLMREGEERARATAEYG